MRRIFQHFYNFWTIFNFTWLMLVCVPWVIFFVVIHEKIGGKIGYIILEFWSRLFSALSGIFYKSVGREKLEKGKAYVYTANHGSYLDATAIVAIIPEQCRPLGKVEILDYPIFGLMFKYIGVTVNRSNPVSRQKSLELIKAKLLKGINILIFPEGTMNRTEKTLLPFKDGAFRLAIETQTPIVPLAIHNAKNLFPRGTTKLKAGTVVVEFGEPISVDGLTLTDLDKLKQQVYEVTEKMLQNYTNKN